MTGARLLRGGSARQAPKTFPAARTRPVLCGVTVDDISNISGVLTSINALITATGVKPAVRVVFDQGEPASYYTSAVESLHEVAWVMGELLDSDYEGGADGNPATTTAELSALTTSYMATLGRNVDIWEIGNEVNGNWTETGDPDTWDGSYSLVLAKLAEAYNLVSAQGYQTALTLYANYSAGDGDFELSPEDFSALVPEYIRNGLDYVLLSYYEQDNGSVRPTASEWGTHFELLHALYPNAWQGFGEIGLNDAVTTTGTDPPARGVHRGLLLRAGAGGFRQSPASLLLRRLFLVVFRRGLRGVHQAPVPVHLRRLHRRGRRARLTGHPPHPRTPALRCPLPSDRAEGEARCH